MTVPFLDRLRRMEPSLATLLIVTLGAIAAIGLFFALTAPPSVLLGDSSWAVISAFHGLGATTFLLAATIATYLAWRLYIGEIKAFKDLKWLAAFSTVMSVVTIAFGNWIYIGYRAPGGPRAFFLANMPAIHAVFFEFKEFIALFTLPLTVAAAFILWYYGAQVLDRKWMRYTVAVLLTLAFFYLVVAFGLGAAVTKLRPAPRPFIHAA